MKSSIARKLKQVPPGYRVMRLNAHRKKHATVTITQGFTIHGKFRFNSTKEGFEMALKRAKLEKVETGSTGVIFADRDRRALLRNLAYFLDERGPLTLH